MAATQIAKWKVGLTEEEIAEKLEARKRWPSARRSRVELPMTTYAVPEVRIKLVREDRPSIMMTGGITGPTDSARIIAERIADEDREHVVAIMVDIKNKVLGMHVVSIGTLSAAMCEPREVFKAAILMNAAAIVIGHNHPSGDPTPSAEDVAITRKIKAAGELLGIELLDHVVIGAAGRFVSLRERNLGF